MAIDAQTTLRFLHVLSGIVWIGHLYFFNLTNLPVFKMSIKGNDAGQKGGPHLIMRALWWFRWGAMATLLFGLALMDRVARDNYAGDWGLYMESPAGQTILAGALLGIIMWFNVWFIIWPNQKVVLANNLKIAAGVGDEEKKSLEADNAPRMKKAKNASRFNFWASIPMLLFMVFAAHAPLDMPW